jgi:hypothetical protein
MARIDSSNSAVTYGLGSEPLPLGDTPDFSQSAQSLAPLYRPGNDTSYSFTPLSSGSTLGAGGGGGPTGTGFFTRGGRSITGLLAPKPASGTTNTANPRSASINTGTPSANPTTFAGYSNYAPQPTIAPRYSTTPLSSMGSLSSLGNSTAATGASTGATIGATTSTSATPIFASNTVSSLFQGTSPSGSTSQKANTANTPLNTLLNNGSLSSVASATGSGLQYPASAYGTQPTLVANGLGDLLNKGAKLYNQYVAKPVGQVVDSLGRAWQGNPKPTSGQKPKRSAPPLFALPVTPKPSYQKPRWYPPGSASGGSGAASGAGSSRGNANYGAQFDQMMRNSGVPSAQKVAPLTPKQIQQRQQEAQHASYTQAKESGYGAQLTVGDKRMSIRTDPKTGDRFLVGRNGYTPIPKGYDNNDIKYMISKQPASNTYASVSSAKSSGSTGSAGSKPALAKSDNASEQFNNAPESPWKGLFNNPITNALAQAINPLPTAVNEASRTNRNYDFIDGQKDTKFAIDAVHAREMEIALNVARQRAGKEAPPVSPEVAAAANGLPAKSLYDLGIYSSAQIAAQDPKQTKLEQADPANPWNKTGGTVTMFVNQDSAGPTRLRR